MGAVFQSAPLRWWFAKRSRPRSDSDLAKVPIYPGAYDAATEVDAGAAMFQARRETCSGEARCRVVPEIGGPLQ